MSTATLTRTDSTHPQGETPDDAEIQELLEQGAAYMLQRRLNGIGRRDKEILVMNMTKDVLNDQHPAWQDFMAKVDSLGKNREVFVGQVVDHLFKQLGPVKVS